MKNQKIIDIHTHIWKNKIVQDKKQLIKACKLYGVSKICVSGLGSHYPDEAEIETLNLNVAKFMQEEPDLVRGFCYINPLHENSTDILKKYIEEYKMSGVKLWVSTLCDNFKVFPVIESCINHKIPILIHSFYKSEGQLKFESTGSNVANIAKRYASIIMAHLGGNCYHGIKAIKEFKNVLIDISGSVFRRDDLDYAKEQIGADRILFGTDMPGSYLVNKGQVEEAALTQNERDLIYYKNAATILKTKEELD